MRINYNVSSIIARNALNNNDSRLSNSIERLSSGLKINHAADDAAGLAISIRMNAQIRSLEQANKNANDGISVVNSADGAMSEMHDILQRMNELAIQSANGTNADSDRTQIQLEIDQLVDELDRIAETTEFNAQNLLDGSFAYKGYTNTENVKVKSYSSGVVSGTYAINSVTYSHFSNVVRDYSAYIEKSADGNISTSESYQIGSADGVKDNLVTSATVGIKAFPISSRVLLDDEDIIIKAENDFEIKLQVNDKGAIINNRTTGTTSVNKYYTTDNYQNIAVVDEEGSKKYNISLLNIIEETDEYGNPTGTQTINTGSKEEGLRNLETDLADAFLAEYPELKDAKVTSCDVVSAPSRVISYDGVDYPISDTQISVGVEITNKDGTTATTVMKFTVNLSLQNTVGMTQEEQDKAYAKYMATQPEAVRNSTINYYLQSNTETVETQYTIGTEDDPILLNMTGVGALRLQVGANEGQVLEIQIPALQALYLGLDNLDISTEEAATAAIDKVTDAINQLSGIRARIGAYANRIEHTITNLDTTTENMTAAYSRIMDVDMATEMTEYSTVQVLVQSSTAMLAQANERPQSVLQLLQ